MLNDMSLSDLAEKNADRLGQLFAEVYPKVLVCRVHVGVGEAETGEHEICLRELLSEHLHERNGTAAADVKWFGTLAKHLVNGFLEASFDIGWQVRCIEAVI